MVKFKFGILPILLWIFLIGASPLTYAAQEGEGSEVNADPEEKAEPQKTSDYTLDFTQIIERLSGAVSGEDALQIAEESITNCRTYDDYDRLVAEIKGLAGASTARFTQPLHAGAGFTDVLHYAIGAARFKQLKHLSKTNDIESGRVYMAVADRYYDEALENLDKAALEAGSKSRILDVDFMKTMIFKERFRPQEAENTFDDIVNKLAQYSDDAGRNKKELSRISDKFDQAGLLDYAVKLKIAYAAKVDVKEAKEIFEEIRKSADKYFAQGNLKDAAALYTQYTSLAQAYFPKDEMAGALMEIGERYFSAGKYKEAGSYYELYAQRYSDSSVIDYCSYRIALCFYYEKDYPKAISLLEAFIAAYQTSIWFDRAFENLCRLYYENFGKDKAIEDLRRLIDNYYRKNVGDYAHILIGLLHYGSKDYDNAVVAFKKVDDASIYFYASLTLLDDIAAVKKGAKASFGVDSTNNYRIWEPDKAINAELVNAKAEAVLTQTEDGAPKLVIKKGARLELRLEGLEDLDRYSEYLQDNEDQSRLPKKIKDESERDILFLKWSCEGGKFIDEKETKDKIWQAPDQPGTCKISVSIDDFGLVRLPDTGMRKDSPKVLSVIVAVE